MKYINKKINNEYSLIKYSDKLKDMLDIEKALTKVDEELINHVVLLPYMKEIDDQLAYLVKCNEKYVGSILITIPDMLYDDDVSVIINPFNKENKELIETIIDYVSREYTGFRFINIVLDKNINIDVDDFDNHFITHCKNYNENKYSYQVANNYFTSNIKVFCKNKNN